MSDEFLGLSMSNVLHTYFIMLLDKKPLQICLGTCARERKVECSFQAHALRDFADTKQYMIPYVSNSN